ncbi:MAG: permease-like cell division protein FtsX [Coprococcus sp.]|nr:permease-like cell division protein FtsX [Coprococcus sp.]
MKISTFFYILRQGFSNIRRNILFSLASLGTIISCLFLFGIIYAVVVNFQSGMKELENTITISVFFEEDLPEESVQLIGEQIRVLDYVNTMDYISPEEALKNFCEQNYDDPEAAMEAFGDENPLRNSASYSVTLKDVSKQAEFVAYAKDLQGVRSVKSSDVTADGLSTLSSLVGYASVGIVVILMLVSIFLISNTITIGITVRKEEIGIMKLIGATNFFVRAPFIIEGIIIGAVGSAIPLVLLYEMYEKILAYVVGRFKVITSIFAFVSQEELFKTMIPVGLVLGIGVGLFGSLVTTRKHLKV